MKTEQHLIMRSIKYGMEHAEFTDSEFQKEMNLSKEESFLTAVFFSNNLEPNVNALFQRVNTRNVKEDSGAINTVYVYSLLPSALFAYLDLMEMQQAREFSQESSTLARKAISRSTIAIWVSIVIGVLQLIIAVMQFK